MRLLRARELSAQEVGVLVGLEVRETQDDGTGPERGGEGPDTLREPVNEELCLVLISSRKARDLELDLGRERSVAG